MCIRDSRGDVDGTQLFIAEVYQSSGASQPIARAGVRIVDTADEFQIVCYILGVLYEWDGIKYLVDTLALNHHAQAPDYNTHPTALCDMACEYITQKKPEMCIRDRY